MGPENPNESNLVPAMAIFGVREITPETNLEPARGHSPLPHSFNDINIDPIELTEFDYPYAALYQPTSHLYSGLQYFGGKINTILPLTTEPQDASFHDSFQLIQSDRKKEISVREGHLVKLDWDW